MNIFYVTEDQPKHWKNYGTSNYMKLQISQKNSSATFEKLNRCLDDIKEWMSAGKLKLNLDKTEFIVFGSK